MNPELDYHLAKSLGQTTPYDRVPLQDRALQTALEGLLAIEFLVLPEMAPPPVKPAADKESKEEERASKPAGEEEAPAPPAEKEKREN